MVESDQEHEMADKAPGKSEIRQALVTAMVEVLKSGTVDQRMEATRVLMQLDAAMEGKLLG